MFPDEIKEAQKDKHWMTSLTYAIQKWSHKAKQKIEWRLWNMDEDIDRCWSKGTEVQLDRRNDSADMYILTTIFLKTASKVNFVFLSQK